MEQGIEARITALAKLGEIMLTLGKGHGWPGHGSGCTLQEFQELDEAIIRAQRHNGWATEENVRHAFAVWGDSLTEEELRKWLSAYPEATRTRAVRRVGAILAGNVPLVGLHDVLCIWLSGHVAQVKLSSQEPELIPLLTRTIQNSQFVNGIIYGNNQNEFQLEVNDDAMNVFTFDRFILRTDQNTSDLAHFPDQDRILRNQDPRFVSIQDRNFRLDPQSPARNQAMIVPLDNVSIQDIVGKPRPCVDQLPSLGAFEYCP